MTVRSQRATSLEWLLTLPEDWDDGEIGREVYVRARLGWKGLTASEYVDEGIPMLATPEIKGRAIDFASANRISLERYEESPEIMLSPGDVLLTKDGSTIGTVNVVRELSGPATVNGSIAVLTPTGRADGRFLYWFIASSYAQATFDRLRGGMGVPHLFQRDINRIKIPLPPLFEQRAIADYLDRETARIDTLIDEQQRLIDLLRERRQDLIAENVLGGLNPLEFNPSTPMTAIGHRYTVVLGKMLDGGRDVRAGDLALPYLRAGNIQDHGLDLSDVNTMMFSESEATNLDLRAGDLVVVEGGAVGTSAVIDSDMVGWSFQKTVNRVRPVGEWSPAWLGYVLRAYRDAGVIDIVCNKSTIPHLTAEKLRGLRVPDTLPAEQTRIVRILDEQTAKIDTLIEESQRFIELSRERRSALITAAVTGQIDVRTVA